jgi:hypothetical protein
LNWELCSRKKGTRGESLKDYREAKLFAVDVKGDEYIDRRGNPFEIAFVRKKVDAYIERVAKLKDSKDCKK